VPTSNKTIKRRKEGIATKEHKETQKRKPDRNFVCFGFNESLDFFENSPMLMKYKESTARKT